VGRREGGQKAPDRHPGPDGQTDIHTHTHTHKRQNLYILIGGL